MVFLLGQTSTGKSEMAVEIAKLCDGWIIGCDSRQIYKELNLGTGKVAGNWENINQESMFFYKNIPHFLIDYVEPDQKYTIQNYQQDFRSLVGKINTQDRPFGLVKPKMLIITGGTAFWAKVISGQIQLNQVKLDFERQYQKLKIMLQSLSLESLKQIYNDLKNTQKELKVLNQSDQNNPYRLQTWILNYEAKRCGWFENKEGLSSFSIIFLAIQPQSDLNEKIKNRLLERLALGLIDEVINFGYLGFERMSELGLEYRLGYYYLQGFCTYNELVEKLIIENQKLAKRQLTYLKNWQNLIWIKKLNKQLIKDL
jgi:tRNA dimethylallyltransferase